MKVTTTIAGIIFSFLVSVVWAYDTNPKPVPMPPAPKEGSGAPKTTPVPSPKDFGAPKVTPPGLPVVGMFQQHFYTDGFAALVEVDKLWDEQGDLVRFYFNSRRVSHAADQCKITVWFLEEYTPYGRKKFNLGRIAYKYYKVSLVYCDLSGEGYLGAFDYEVEVPEGGEVLDGDKKVIGLVSGVKLHKITIEETPYALLGSELKNRYNLK